MLAAPAAWRTIGHIHIGGPGSWDYVTVDSAARRLYVSHATHVVVVDLDSEKVVGDIPDTPGVHGIAIAAKLGRGFISNGRANNVTVFDLKTLKTLRQVATGQNPDAIFYDEPTNTVFTFNGRSHDATAFDASTYAVKATLPLGGKPEFAASDGKGKLWVNIEDTHEIVELSTAKPAVVRRYTLPGCEEPSGLAFDPQRRRLFSVCGNKVMVVSDPDSGKAVAALPIGEGSDGAAYDPGTGLAFSSNGEGTLTVVRLAGGKYEVAETAKTTRGARTIALDPQSHKLYLPAARYSNGNGGQPGARPAAAADSFHVLVLAQ
jgi:DNA-binding beta-propeller fold protein YncE